MSRPVEILHIAAIHPPYDTRVVYKMCSSLAKNYQLKLIIPEGSAIPNTNVEILGVPRYKKLWQRLLYVHPFVLWKALNTKAKVVQIYSPELIPIAFIFWLLGKRIVYDVQENLFKKLNI